MIVYLMFYTFNISFRCVSHTETHVCVRDLHNPGFISHWLCGLEHVILPLCFKFLVYKMDGVFHLTLPAM